MMKYKHNFTLFTAIYLLLCSLFFILTNQIEPPFSINFFSIFSFYNLSLTLLFTITGIYIIAVIRISYKRIIESEKKNNQSANLNKIYLEILNTIPYAIVHTDMDGTIKFINVTGEVILLKHSHNKIIGSNVLSLIAPEDKERAIMNLQVRELGSMEYKIVFNDGISLTCDVNVQQLNPIYSSINGMIFVIQDITQRKKNEKELQERESRYYSFIETANNIVFEISTDGSFTYLNSKSQEILGYPLEELYKKRIFDLIIPEEIPLVVKRFNEDLEKKKRTLFFEVSSIHGTSNRKMFFDINSDLILSELGDVIGFRGIARNITARKQYELEIEESKKRLEMLMHEGKMGFWHIDLPKDLTYMDEIWASILGYSEDEISGIHLDRLLKICYPEDIPEITKFIQSACNGSPSCSLEHRMLTKQGGVKWVSSLAKVAKYNNDGQPIELIGLMRDITEHKNAELKVIEANTTKDKLFSIIAHDLKNPFSTILGFSELLSKNINFYNTQKISELISYINSSTKSLYTLLENLLDWANSQRGRTQFNPQNIHLENVINEEINYLAYFSGEKNIAINQFQNEIDVFADYYLLKTIIRNLITNAIKYSKSGDSINIFSTPKNDCVEITVSDCGIGMSDETIGALFSFEMTKFQNGTANEHGTGLGLILCKEFVEKHKGKIWVESKLGEGSEFTFTLPNQ